MRITTLACLTTFLTLPPLALTVTAARAENGHDSGGLSYVAGDLELTFSLDAGLGFFTVPNAQNGAGSFSPHGSRASRRDWPKASSLRDCNSTIISATAVCMAASR
ncbi:hypothetical protein [uncultured Ferrovibrio sp.]|uniref:hypothetical protein n=1 Tax=uncultured Ferrovibrio sp. TaxID=1576913 RepID=UPI0026370CBE|nr:hypothetical protein [uncultured Ferrovibrio sp.]